MRPKTSTTHFCQVKGKEVFLSSRMDYCPHECGFSPKEELEKMKRLQQQEKQKNLDLLNGRRKIRMPNDDNCIFYRRLQMSGDTTYQISIPKHFIQKFDLKKNDVVKLTINEKIISINLEFFEPSVN